MSFNITRMKAYALLSAIETDLRELIKAHVFEEQKVNPDLLKRSRERLTKDNRYMLEEAKFLDLIDYFDLGDTFQTINSNKELFPNAIASLIKKFNKDFENLIPIRNRVMHIRPLNFDDLTIINKFCVDFIKSDNSIKWNNIENTFKRIEQDPSFVLALEIKNFDEDNVISHNLPIPDFDETGLIGRDKEIEHLKKVCLGATFPVISIVGEGGVGKSALALKVAYDLIEKDNKFDAVIWVTSKTTQITMHEIHAIKGAIDSSLGVIQEIGNQIAGSKDNGHTLDEVIEYLETFKIALFIDNLETILDENIKNFIQRLPEGSKVIITSRIGLGAYEYPIKLEGLETTYATIFLRTLSNIRGVQVLSKLPEPTLAKYVNRMHRNPSYIKWFVSSVQTGLSIETILQNSNDFLDFCMSNVYKYLSSDAQQVTASMLCLEGYKDLPELAEVNEFDAVRLQKAILELLSTNMLSQSSDTKNTAVKNMYQLSELSRAYLRKHHKPSYEFQKKIRDKRNKLNSIFEQQMLKHDTNKYNPINIKFREKSDRVIVKKLYDVQMSIKNNQYDKAYDLLQEAQRLAPDYFEVARFAAYFYQKNGDLTEAREKFELAIHLAPNTPQLHYWFGKFLSSQEYDYDEALNQFKIAHKLDPDSFEVAVILARSYLLTQYFDDAQNILNQFEKYVGTEKNDFLVKTFYDVNTQIEYRKADSLSKEGKGAEALEQLSIYKDKFSKIPHRYKDQYLINKLQKCDYIVQRINKDITSQIDKDKLEEFSSWFNKESNTQTST